MEKNQYIWMRNFCHILADMNDVFSDFCINEWGLFSAQNEFDDNIFHIIVSYLFEVESKGVINSYPLSLCLHNDDE